MTAQHLSLQATKRTLLGRGVKKLRSEGKIPANIYGKETESLAITLDGKEFSKLYKQAGETALIQLTVEGEKKTRPVLVRDVALHPLTMQMQHIDFQQVDLNEKVTAMIPVETTGESAAVKGGAVLVVVYNELEVEALPTDLPEKFEINLEKLAAIGDAILVSDVTFDRSKVTLTVADDEVLATVQAQEEDKAEEVASEPVEVELTKQGATKEEEAPAGDAKKE